MKSLVMESVIHGEGRSMSSRGLFFLYRTGIHKGSTKNTKAIEFVYLESDQSKLGKRNVKESRLALNNVNEKQKNSFSAP